LAGWILETLKKEFFKDNDQYAEKQDYYILYTLLLYRLVLNQNKFHISAKHFQDCRNSTLTISLYTYSAECHSKLPVNFKPYDDRPH